MSMQNMYKYISVRIKKKTINSELVPVFSWCSSFGSCGTFPRRMASMSTNNLLIAETLIKLNQINLN